MIITNFKILAKNPLRKKALQIVEAGYEAIGIERVVRQRVSFKNNRLSIRGTMINHSADLGKYKNVYLVGIGKGSALASVALAKILNKRLTKGIALDTQPLHGFTRIRTRINTDKKIEFLTGTHPLSSIKNVKATKKIIELAQKAGEGDLIISFICGGGSALLCGSEKELKASREIFEKLTNAGANIVELNTIRKHLSEVKGGGLAKIAYPATMISLVVSDIFSGDLSTVASGPTIYDKTTKKDAERIIKKYQVSSIKYQALETPKDKKYFKKVKNILFISNRESIAAMAKKAKQLGFAPKIYSYGLKGEAKNSLLPLAEVKGKNMAVIAGGETTIKLGKNPGKGGRNMEAVLGALSELKHLNTKSFLFVSFASDGKDNVNVAGAIGDILTINKAGKLKLKPEKYLKNHSTFDFFKKTGDLISTDKKTFNVSDLMLVLSLSKE